jgi:hypothetical protein
MRANPPAANTNPELALPGMKIGAVCFLNNEQLQKHSYSKRKSSGTVRTTLLQPGQGSVAVPSLPKSFAHSPGTSRLCAPEERQRPGSAGDTYRHESTNMTLEVRGTVIAAFSA